MLQMVLSTEDDTGNIWWLFQLWGMKENVNVAGSYVWSVTRILPLDGHFKSLYDLMRFYYCVLSVFPTFSSIPKLKETSPWAPASHGMSS